MKKKTDPVPKTVKPSDLKLTPESLLAEQAKAKIEQQRKDLKARLLRTGGYKS